VHGTAAGNRLSLNHSSLPDFQTHVSIVARAVLQDMADVRML
jgi:hypothetical protein